MSYLVEQLPYCDLLRLSLLTGWFVLSAWQVVLIIGLKKKAECFWTFFLKFRVLCLFCLAKAKGGPTVFGLSAFGRVLRTCSDVLCHFYLTKLKEWSRRLWLANNIIFRRLWCQKYHPLKRQSASDLLRCALPFLFDQSKVVPPKLAGPDFLKILNYETKTCSNIKGGVAGHSH